LSSIVVIAAHITQPECNVKRPKPREPKAVIHANLLTVEIHKRAGKKKAKNA